MAARGGVGAATRAGRRWPRATGTGMHLTYSEQHRALEAEIREFARTHGHLSPAPGGGRKRPGRKTIERQRLLLERGYVARTIPREYGGRGAAPDVLEAAIIADEWLPRIATGTARLAVAVEGATGRRALGPHDGRLSGRLDTVLDLAGATHVLVAVADGALAIVAADAPEARASLGPSLDRTRPVGECLLDGCPAEIVAEGADAGGLVAAGRAMLAADSRGAAQTMLDRAVAHARQREQFGRLIGSFQAVKHLRAEMAAMLEPARALVWYAAHAQDALLDEARLLACHAKAHLGETGREVARMATEVHGGMGFTHELGLHYWFKRLSANRQLLGGPELCRREAAALQGWSAA
jgi:alkylation response protein AidB-like acyl-CoA dehydrogenase